MHEKMIVHRDLKPANLIMPDEFTVLIGDYGTSRLLPKAGKFVAEVTMAVNTTHAGTDNYKSAEMNLDQPNGLPTDIWSLAIIIGYWLGLFSICPYDLSVAKFIKEYCATGKANFLLAKHEIFIYPLLQDVMK